MDKFSKYSLEECDLLIGGNSKKLYVLEKASNVPINEFPLEMQGEDTAVEIRVEGNHFLIFPEVDFEPGKSFPIHLEPHAEIHFGTRGDGIGIIILSDTESMLTDNDPEETYTYGYDNQAVKVRISENHPGSTDPILLITPADIQGGTRESRLA